MIFQEPMTSLNPVFTCGDQIAEAVALHNKVSRGEAWDRAIQMLEQVGIADAKRRAKSYPHQLSGGMPTSPRPPSTSRSRPRSWS
jgi:ABC-type microcin C transport system duplicated ATPase subunit YejF